MIRSSRSLRVFAASALVLTALVLTLPITLAPGIRKRLTAGLEERFDSQVDMQALRVSVLPRLRISGDAVVLRHKDHGGRSDLPPLITIKSFSAEASLFRLFGRPLRLSRVRLDGLEINLPPGGVDIGRREGAASPPPATDSATPGRKGSPLVVDDLIAERAVLRLLRREAGKPARLFEIHQLSMQGTGADRPWPFSAALTNPTPPGQIQTQGTFGPWNAADPAATPLDAKYEFHDADLGVFDGIRGTLQSSGRFSGVLERIEVDGRADVPDFALDAVGNPVTLKTTFHSTVDGTNGNTLLEPVEAMLLKTPILAKGGVVERAGEDGRAVTLQVEMKGGRIEDVLRLAVKGSRPPMAGTLQLKTAFVLPPGRGDPIGKLRLDGSFAIDDAKFLTGDVQAKLTELSRKAVGDAQPAPGDVVSDFTGAFVMTAGVLRFSRISFTMPGTRVDLAGSYSIRSEALDFRGTVRLDARLSQLTTGAKSLLLRAVDPLLRRRNATVIPITIGGTAADPKFGLDVKRTLLRR